MMFTKTIGVSAIALMAMVQFVPAPPLALGIVSSVASGVAGAIHHHRREAEAVAPAAGGKSAPAAGGKSAPAAHGQSAQPDFDACRKAAKAAKPAIHIGHPNGDKTQVSFANVPKACMDVAKKSFEMGQPGDPLPKLQEPSTLLYTKLSADGLKKIKDALGAQGE